jgi:hypothetical protein
MEYLFVRLLNATLLTCAFLSLLVVVGAVGFLGLNIRQATFPDASNRDITVPYHPSNVVSARSADTSRPAPSNANADSDSLAAARASCNATNDLYVFVSSGKFNLANSEKCPSAMLDAATSEYGDRALNYLSARAAYIKALLADDQARAIFTVPPNADISAFTDKALSDVDATFSQQFHTAAATDDARKLRELALAAESKNIVFLCAGVAASAFISFLIVAFLLVAVRVEKHLGNIAAKIPVLAPVSK